MTADLRPRTLVRIFLIAIASLFLFAAIACGDSSDSATGTDAPDFSLPVANGAGNITLSQYQGDKNVVLVFYRGFF